MIMGQVFEVNFMVLHTNVHHYIVETTVQRPADLSVNTWCYWTGINPISGGGGVNLPPP